MDSNILFDLAISTVITTVKAVVKNKKKKEELKRVFLKVRNTINAAYAGDPDFEPETAQA